jgi:hypothetical protein
VWFNFILNGYLNVFEKMHLEESISKIKLISNELCCEKLKPFCESLDEITTITPFSVQHFDDNKRGYLRNLFNNIQPNLDANVSNGHKILEDSLEVLNKKRSDVKQLEDTLVGLKSKHQDELKNVQDITKRCEKYEKKLKELQNLRDCIKTYKLLTGTHFVYKTDSTAGYIQRDQPLYCEVFDFKHSKISQHEITKKLWMLLEKVSEKDCKSQIEEPSG